MKIDFWICSKTGKGRVISKNFAIADRQIFGLVFKLGAKRIVLLKAKKGYIMCGYLNLAAAEKFDDAACIVKGVKTIKDLLKAKIVFATKRARKLGVYPDMKASEAILKLS
ncbi:MAG: DUF1805 domain-containing protein [Candidatus Omnitrophica bacterium]|nr:DUF1805 domain-containing protein [Candidatus Omnitrophota bacterium]